MSVVFGLDKEVADYVSKGLGQLIAPPYVAIGFQREGRICGGVVFNQWNGSNIEATAYGPTALTRTMIGRSFRYVFVQSKAQRMTAKTKRTNKAMQRILPRLGFVFEGVAKRYFGPTKQDDAFVYALFPENAMKWNNA